MKWVGKIFFRGLITLLPVVALGYLVVSFFAWAESLVGGLLVYLFPEVGYIPPGLGVIFGVAFIFILGLVMSNIISTTLFSYFEKFIESLPILKSIYSAIKDLMTFFSPAEKGRTGKVVSVKWPGHPMELIGFLTNENLSTLPGDIDRELKVAVYFPMSYQIGGYTVFIPSDWVTELDISVEVAMRSALTAWMPKDKP